MKRRIQNTVKMINNFSSPKIVVNLNKFIFEKMYFWIPTLCYCKKSRKKAKLLYLKLLQVFA